MDQREFMYGVRGTLGELGLSVEEQGIIGVRHTGVPSTELKMQEAKMKTIAMLGKLEGLVQAKAGNSIDYIGNKISTEFKQKSGYSVNDIAEKV